MRAIEPVTIQCPHCFQSFEVQLEADVAGRMVCDCEICCAPLELDVRHDGDRTLASVSPAEG